MAWQIDNELRAVLNLSKTFPIKKSVYSYTICDIFLNITKTKDSFQELVLNCLPLFFSISRFTKFNMKSCVMW